MQKQRFPHPNVHLFIGLCQSEDIATFLPHITAIFTMVPCRLFLWSRKQLLKAIDKNKVSIRKCGIHNTSYVNTLWTPSTKVLVTETGRALWTERICLYSYSSLDLFIPSDTLYCAHSFSLQDPFVND